MNFLMIHGINFDEDHDPNYYDAWFTAITEGLKSANYTKPIVADPKTNSIRYNAIFDKYSDNPEVYAAAVGELLADWAWHSIFGPSPRTQYLKKPEQPPDDTFSLRWTAGMVAQWIVEEKLRKDCCETVFQAIKRTTPDIIFAHSLGSLLVYDFLLNDPRAQKSFNGIFVTFGSQIGNAFVMDSMWGGEVRELKNVKAWYSLYNCYDIVFVEPIECFADNYMQFMISPPFGTGSWYNFDGHQATHGDGKDGDVYPGYLDNSTTDSILWPLLADGTTASLYRKRIEMVKRVSNKFPSRFSLLSLPSSKGKKQIQFQRQPK